MVSEEHSHQIDMTAARDSYSRFTGLIKWGTILSALVAVFVVILIAS